ncbi:MAG: hypothetical protein CVU39_24530 [Chloroflexi bacterium HGW-Chloroflexi-10]|nr:MAG: hypothetical protein CVU39_24530 [Chloroflexi bacterium HGW-Chloroflexi-10]
MEKKNFRGIDEVRITSWKNVYIRSWDREDSEIRYSQSSDFEDRLEGSCLSIFSKRNLLISIPATVKVVIQSVSGNCEILNGFQEVVINKVDGNLEIEQTNSVSVDKVGGNVRVGKIKDNGHFVNIGGNIKLNSGGSLLQLEHVGGNLTATSEQLAINGKVGGNAKLNIKSLLDQESKLFAGGNLKLSFSGSPDMELIASSGGLIKVELNGEVEKTSGKIFKRTFGTGLKKLEVRAGGNIKISSEAWDEELEMNFMESSESHWDDLERQVEMRVENDFGINFTGLFDLERQIGNEVQSRTRKAEERIQQAMEKINRKVGFSNGFNVSEDLPNQGSSSVTNQKQSTGVSDEERMLILKMLQEKKITAEEADRLLEALELS